MSLLTALLRVLLVLLFVPLIPTNMNSVNQCKGTPHVHSNTSVYYLRILGIQVILVLHVLLVDPIQGKGLYNQIIKAAM